MTLVSPRRFYNRFNIDSSAFTVAKLNPVWDGEAISMTMLCVEPEPKVITFEKEDKQRNGFRDKFGSIMLPKRDVEDYAYRGVKPYMHMPVEEPWLPCRLNTVALFIFLKYELAKNQKQLIVSLRQATIHQMRN